MSNFKNNLAVILAGRKITPWGKSLNISNAVIQAMNEGSAPGSEYLQLISRAENANINFLLNGQGAPFLVQQGDAACILEWLAKREPADPGFLHLACFNGQAVIGLETWESIVLRKREIEYRRFDLLRTKLNKPLVDALNEFGDVRAFNCDETFYRELAGGNMGTFLCVGDDVRKGQFYDFAQVDLNTVKLTPAAETHQVTDIKLMRAVLELVDETIADYGETLTAAERAKIVTSLYNSAVQMGTSAQALERGRVLSLLEILN